MEKMKDAVENITVPTKKRIEYIDLAKGLCILFVVWLHTKEFFHGYHHVFETEMSAFRMPLYFILSGIFFKTYGGLWNFTKKKINKLLIPFVTFYLALSFFLPFVLSMVSSNSVEGGFSISLLWAFVTPENFPNRPIWFLISLFEVNMICFCLQKASSFLNEKIQFPVYVFMGCLLGLLGVYCGHSKINLPMYIDSSLSCTPFFIFGSFLKQKTNILSDHRKIVCIVVVVLSIIYLNCFARVVHIRGNSVPDAWIFYSCGIVGSLGILFFAQIFKRIPLISYFGRYSIMILLTHNVIIKPLYGIVKKFDLSPAIGSLTILVITMLLYLAIIPVMLKFLPYVTAQKDVLK